MRYSVPVAVVVMISREGGRGTELLLQRRANTGFGDGMWDLACSGHVERGETPIASCVRECREELGIVLAVGDVYAQVVHAYPDLTVRLTLFHAAILEGEPQALEHCELRWATREELSFLPFCPADQPILERIRKEGL